MAREWSLTTSSLITAINTVSSPITTVSGLDALSIAAQECSTLTGGYKNVTTPTKVNMPRIQDLNTQ